MRKSITTFALILAVMTLQIATAQVSSNPWQNLNNPTKGFKAKADRWARSYASFRLLPDDMRNLLSDVPMQGSNAAKTTTFVFNLPMPDGSFSAFRLVESPVMEAGLAAAYPQIKTYLGRGIDDPTATMRCDITLFGFHAMMISSFGTVFVDPADRFVNSEYISYYKSDALPQDFAQECLITGHEEEQGLRSPSSTEATIAGYIRNYRLALACTGEYAAYHGGTVIGALSAMVTSVNRVNGVYERELGIHMNLVDNDTLLIYLNASTDPYSNSNGGSMLGQNQTICDNLIGQANYDIGHVFSTGGGGIAGLGVICSNGDKANGVTGLDTPIGDAFDIDYVAHEMGHQFGGNHTFNSTTGACSGNRVSSAAYEPGSASTIMGYAGICGNQDLQPHSDDYFHTKSYDEIITYTVFGQGNTCPVKDTTANHAPTITTLPANFNIPLNTPFRLTAVASDVDGDSITYCWEEFDKGAAGVWNAPAGNAPIFRSFNPVTTGTRIFPKLQNILSNTTTIGEIKPSYARTLNFRCIVRDNNLDGAGVTYNPTSVKVYVAGTSGPFAVTSPNTTGIVWVQSSVETVTWDVSNSDVAPVNTPTVNILLSIDGGYTWPYVLATGVPNNGSYAVNVPAVNTTTARVMVEGAGNIFFDINNANFTISDGAGISGLNNKDGISLLPNPTTGYVNLQLNSNERGSQEVVITDLTGKVVQSFVVNKDSQQLNIDLQLGNLNAGVYIVHIKGSTSVLAKKIIKT